MNDLVAQKATDLIERARACKVIARHYIAAGDTIGARRWLAYAQADLAEAKALVAKVRG